MQAEDVHSIAHDKKLCEVTTLVHMLMTTLVFYISFPVALLTPRLLQDHG
jgi:hypothetical protein